MQEEPDAALNYAAAGLGEGSKNFVFLSQTRENLFCYENTKTNHSKTNKTSAGPSPCDPGSIRCLKIVMAGRQWGKPLN